MSCYSDVVSCRAGYYNHSMSECESTIVSKTTRSHLPGAVPTGSLKPKITERLLKPKIPKMHHRSGISYMETFRCLGNDSLIVICYGYLIIINLQHLYGK